MEQAVVRNVPVVWKMKESEADRLLGKTGRPVLEQVIGLMQRYAKEQDWPVEQIDVKYWQDLEFADWEEVLLVPVFRASPEKAEACLATFLDEIDALQKTLGETESCKLIEVIGFDAETA